MAFPVPGQAAPLEPLLLRSVGGGAVIDEDLSEIHLSTFFAITQDLKLHKRMTLHVSVALRRHSLQLSRTCIFWDFMNVLLIL